MKPIYCHKGWAILLALLLSACNQATDPTLGEEERPISIAALKSRCNHLGYYPIRESLHIEARITANDAYGEFYKTLVIEDESGGISIAIDHPTLYEEFSVGTPLTLYCNGLYLYDFGGKIMLGTISTEEGVGRIAQEEIARYIRLGEPPTQGLSPTLLTFGEVTMRHTDCYVRFDGVRFADEGQWCAWDALTERYLTTEHPIIDSEGYTFTVRVLGSCYYATEPLPHGWGSLGGIIDYFDGKFSLRVAGHKTLF